MVENKPKSVRSTDDVIRLQDLWGMFLPRWRWFAASLLVSCSLATYYLMSTPPQYTRTTSILIKDDSKGGKMGSGNNNVFGDLAFLRNNTNINNELLTIQSPMIMTEVVKRLGLDEVYTVEQGLQTVDLYKSAPCLVTFAHKRPEAIHFQIRILSKDKYELFNLKAKDVKESRSYVAKWGDKVKTPAGVLAVTPTKRFSEEWIGKDLAYTKVPLFTVADVYGSRLRAALDHKEATIVTMSISDPSPQKAEDVLNTLVEVYNDFWVKDKNQIAISTSRFINDRLSVIERELDGVDEDISAFKSRHLLPDLQAASHLYMNQSAENMKQIFALESKLYIAQYIHQELSRKSIDQPLPANTGIANVNIESQITEYNRNVLDRNRLISNSNGQSPVVADLTASIEALKQSILLSVNNLIVSLQTEIKSLNEQEAKATNNLASSPSQAKYLLNVERQQGVKEKLYLYLLQKREENELSQTFTAYNTRVITAPRGSEHPTSPVKAKVLLTALLIGLLLPAVVIYLLDVMNNKVRGRKDLEKLTVPLVGEIPYYNPNKKLLLKRRSETSSQALVVEDGNHDIINEAFRVLRSNLDFMSRNGEHPAKVFMMTSFNPGSGKSFLSANLAMSFALKGKKVMVIDADLRHGSLSAYAGSPQKGLSSYLAGHTDEWMDLLVSNPQSSNLQLLPIGVIPPNPAELLENGRLQALIHELREHYDYVILDCPPIDIVADTQIISSVADRTLFVVRAGLLDRNMLPEIDSLCQKKRFPALSLILNSTKVKGSRYSYRYGYYYGKHPY